MQSDKILLVERDPRLIETLVDVLVRRFSSSITCVSTAEDALDVQMLEPHALAIIDCDDHFTEGLVLSERLRELCDAPAVLLANDPSVDHALEALRSGVADVIIKPCAVEQFVESIERTLAASRQCRQFKVRYHRMRSLLRRVLRERRQLNDRVELICKDLVGAHRRLVQRVVTDPDA